jgi:hypothetical protein
MLLRQLLCVLQGHNSRAAAGVLPFLHTQLLWVLWVW